MIYADKKGQNVCLIGCDQKQKKGKNVCLIGLGSKAELLNQPSLIFV